MKALINVDYTDSSEKFWFESYIKNQVVTFDETKETIHDVIKSLCREEGMILSYNGKPRGYVFRDTRAGEMKIVGYMYRGKSEIHDRDMVKPQIGYFDVWVTIQRIEEFEFEEIGVYHKPSHENTNK